MKNRRGAACAVCSTYVRPQHGTLNRRGDGWEVRCSKHPVTAYPVPPGPVDTEAEPIPAEVRVTGTPEQCAVIYEALALDPRMSLRNRSEPYAQHEQGDERVRVYGQLAIQPDELAAVRREQQELT